MANENRRLMAAQMKLASIFQKHGQTEKAFDAILAWKCNNNFDVYASNYISTTLRNLDNQLKLRRI